VNSTPLLFDIEDMVVSRPFQRVAPNVDHWSQARDFPDRDAGRQAA
jgi:hypothetical protein